MEREALYGAIEVRVDAMLAAGATQEVAKRARGGASQTARKAVGFEDLCWATASGWSGARATMQSVS